MRSISRLRTLLTATLASLIGWAATAQAAVQEAGGHQPGDDRLLELASQLEQTSYFPGDTHLYHLAQNPPQIVGGGSDWVPILLAVGAVVVVAALVGTIVTARRHHWHWHVPLRHGHGHA